MEKEHDDLDFGRALHDDENEFAGLLMLATSGSLTDENFCETIDALAMRLGGKLVRTFEEVFPEREYQKVYEHASKKDIALLDIIAEQIQGMYTEKNLDRGKITMLCRKARSITHPTYKE
jgi:hypothetical protein